mgnify:CR=1 FL=1
MLYFGLTLFALYLVFKMIYIVFRSRADKRKSPEREPGKTGASGYSCPLITKRT